MTSKIFFKNDAPNSCAYINSGKQFLANRDTRNPHKYLLVKLHEKQIYSAIWEREIYFKQKIR